MMTHRYVMRVRFALVVLALTCSAAFPQTNAQSDRDFSGRWFLNPAKSEINALPEKPDPILKVDQQPSTIHLYRVAESAKTPAEEISTYSTDGQEMKRRVGQSVLSSQTKWEGAALLINTNVSSPRESYSISERWKKSRDGSRLTVTRSIKRRDGESESTLVYERELKPAGPQSLVVAEAKSPAAPELPVSETPVLRVAPNSEAPQPTADFIVPEGTKLPLRLLNSVNTKYSSPGDRVYLETVYPILSHGRVIIPPGSYVTGSLSEVKRAGRVKGKSEFYLRFDTLTLPNGTTRDFRSRMSNMNGNGKGTFDRTEGKVQGEGGKGNDTRTVATATAAGTGIGAIAGGAAGHLGMGAGIGAAAGALGGLASVLATRGPDAVLEKGSTVEMVLDRQLTFTPDELRSH